MTTDTSPAAIAAVLEGVTDRVAKSICAEQCAVYGEPPCYTMGEWPNAQCNEPGCMALAAAAVPAIAAELATLQARVAELEGALTHTVAPFDWEDIFVFFQRLLDHNRAAITKGKP
jgi:hypothetical protein